MTQSYNIRTAQRNWSQQQESRSVISSLSYVWQQVILGLDSWKSQRKAKQRTAENLSVFYSADKG